MLSTNQIMALSFGTALTPGLLANILLIVVFLHSKLMEKHENLIFFRLVFNLLLLDTLQLLNMVYLAVTTWLQDYLLPESAQAIPGFMTLFTFYAMCMMLIATAINRYFSVCNVPLYVNTFTPLRTTLFVIFVWPIAASIAAICYFVLPCCGVSVDYQGSIFKKIATAAIAIRIAAYGFNFRHVTGINYVNKFVDTPFWVTVVLVNILCYTRIVWHIRRSAMQVTSGISVEQQKRKAMRNIRIAGQFALISSFFLFMNLFFDVFPYLVPTGTVVPYSAIPFCYIANSSVNSLVYLAMNEEIQRNAINFLCCRKITISGTSNGHEFQKTGTRAKTRAT